MRRGEPDGYYHQDTEIRLLASLLSLLENRDVIDVGAERGSIVDALLTAGAATVYAFEPLPASVEALRQTFGENASVRIFGLALGAQDGTARLHVVEDKTGQVPDAYHSLVAFEETPTLRIVDEIEVQVRTLDSLVTAGVLPPRVGVLKVDTERGDLDVLRGMAACPAPS